MSKVFISGSISIKTLPESIKDSIKRIISQKLEILVGDAHGIDSIVQDFLSGKDSLVLIVCKIRYRLMFKKL